MKTLKKNLEQVKTNIANAALRAGRLPDEVKLIAVTKTIDADVMKEILDLGVYDVGENRVQDALSKFEVIGGRASWHMIGRLQKNKAKYVAKFCRMVHSVDTYELASELNKEAKKNDKTLLILIQVNVSGEESKQGVCPEDLLDLIKEISVLRHVKIKGLMTMAPFGDNPEESRSFFKDLCVLRNKMAEENVDNVDMIHLSMGMTQDYEVAVEEGATFVRVGSALFC